MTGFDSTWYHGPFAAGFFQSGNTIDLHFIAPQFLAWFYPANGEIFHAVGMLAFGRDLLSPLLNLGWFVGCLLACLVHRPALPGRALVAGPRRDRAQRPRPRRPGGGGAQRHRRDLLPARRRRDRVERMGSAGRGRARGCAAGPLMRRRAGGGAGGRDQAQLPAAGGGAGRRAGRDRAAGRTVARARRARAWRRWRAAATGTCATSSTPATRCPGSTISARSRCRRPNRPSAVAKRTASSAT